MKNNFYFYFLNVDALLPCHGLYFEKQGFKIFSVFIFRFRMTGINTVHNSAKRTSAGYKNRTVVSRTTALRQFRIWRHTRKWYQKATLKEPCNCETMQLRKTCKVTSFFIRTRPYLTGKHRICLSPFWLMTRQNCETSSCKRLKPTMLWSMMWLNVRDWLSVNTLKSPTNQVQTEKHQIWSEFQQKKNLLRKNVQINKKKTFIF